jgi:aspartyl-tRNA(Asn)/glutamyl-tRNA(Gln) amidotransferase subunit A
VDRPLAPEIAGAWADLRRDLTAVGAVVVDLDAPGLDPAAIPRAVYAEVAAVHREWYRAHPERYGPAIRERLALDMDHGADAVTAAAAWRQGLIGRFERSLAGVDLLLTPTTPTRRKEIGVDLVTAGDSPEPHRPALSWFTNLVNQAGLPALALPLSGTAIAGPPVSIQLIAPAWGEHRLLEIGWGMEERGLVGFQSPPR